MACTGVGGKCIQSEEFEVTSLSNASFCCQPSWAVGPRTPGTENWSCWPLSGLCLGRATDTSRVAPPDVGAKDFPRRPAGRLEEPQVLGAALSPGRHRTCLLLSHSVPAPHLDMPPIVTVPLMVHLPLSLPWGWTAYLGSPHSLDPRGVWLATQDWAGM